jgi:hypothetical protein
LFRPPSAEALGSLLPSRSAGLGFAGLRLGVPKQESQKTQLAPKEGANPFGFAQGRLWGAGGPSAKYAAPRLGFESHLSGLSPTPKSLPLLRSLDAGLFDVFRAAFLSSFLHSIPLNWKGIALLGHLQVVGVTLHSRHPFLVLGDCV